MKCLRCFFLLFYIAFLFVGCSNNDFKPKGFILQDSNYFNLNEDTIIIEKKQFSLVVGIEGWEMQAADTGISVTYLATDDINLKSNYFSAIEEKSLVPNFKSYKIPIETHNNLQLNKPNSTFILKHTFGRTKGKQYCHFSRCKESPALLRLILDFKKIENQKIKDFKNDKLLLFVKVKSQSDIYQYKVLLKFKS